MKLNQWQVAVSAEAFAAGLFARCGCDVSVQYGANQPAYDLVVVNGTKLLKVSVKGSQDGAWGLTQSYKKGTSYHGAVDTWQARHDPKILFCFVQFKDVTLDTLPRTYLAWPHEIAKRLKDSASGRGETILFEYKKWADHAVGAGTIDKIPDNWKFSSERVNEVFSTP